MGVLIYIDHERVKRILRVKFILWEDAFLLLSEKDLGWNKKIKKCEYI